MFVRQRIRPIAIGRLNPCGDWGNIRCGDLHGESRDDEKTVRMRMTFSISMGCLFLFSTLQTYETIFLKNK